ncbi:hypothetical protein RFI_27075, partial [Reticulomyxa filosa]
MSNLPQSEEPFHCESLPDLPTAFSALQCVKLHDEILICGGTKKGDCYSYHLEKKEYKKICCYPKAEALIVHTVVAIETNETADTVTLLSFGGHGTMKISYHTLKMDYQSVWKDQGKHENKWVALPKNITFGEKQSHVLRGARALVGGASQNLLFITRYPKMIDVIDLQSYEYLTNVKNNVLPVADGKFVCYHAFVSVGPNQFIVVCQNETIWMEFDERKTEFVFASLPPCPELTSYVEYSYACFGSKLFILGGFRLDERRDVNSIFVYHITTKQWFSCPLTTPFPVSSTAAVAAVHQLHPFIHVFGGSSTADEQLSMHLLFALQKQ